MDPVTLLSWALAEKSEGLVTDFVVSVSKCTGRLQVVALSHQRSGYAQNMISLAFDCLILFLPFRKTAQLQDTGNNLKNAFS